MKCKIKSSIIERKKKKCLSSLLTINELKEQSDIEIKHEIDKENKNKINLFEQQ